MLKQEKHATHSMDVGVNLQVNLWQNRFSKCGTGMSVMLSHSCTLLRLTFDLART